MEGESARPEFWQDQARAQAIMRQLGGKKNLVNSWRELEKKVADLHDMIALAIEEGD
jgi:hypothetical protein